MKRCNSALQCIILPWIHNNSYLKALPQEQSIQGYHGSRLAYQ